MLLMFKDIVSRLVHEVCDNLDTANLFSVFQWMNRNNKFTHSPTGVFLDTHSFNKTFLNVKIHHWSLQQECFKLLTMSTVYLNFLALVAVTM